MQAIIPWIVGALIQVAGTIVGKVLLSLGIGYVTFTGVDASLSWVRAEFLSGVSGLPALGLQIAGLLKVGVCVSMLTSALTTRLLLQGLTSGTLKRMVVK
jgi:Protein of unknown function (DUF2523)